MVGRLENKMFAANQSGKGGERLTGFKCKDHRIYVPAPWTYSNPVVMLEQYTITGRAKTNFLGLLKAVNSWLSLPQGDISGIRPDSALIPPLFRDSPRKRR